MSVPQKSSFLNFCSELFSLLLNSSDQHSKSLLLFLFHGTELRVVLSSTEGFGTEFREFASIFVPRNEISSCFLFPEGFRMEYREFASIFVPWNGISSCFLFPEGFKIKFESFLFWNFIGITICSVFFVFRGMTFFVGNSQPYQQQQYNVVVFTYSRSP